MTTDPHGDRSATDGDTGTPDVDGVATPTPDSTAAAPTSAGPLPTSSRAPAESDATATTTDADAAALTDDSAPVDSTSAESAAAPVTPSAEPATEIDGRDHAVGAGSSGRDADDHAIDDAHRDSTSTTGAAAGAGAGTAAATQQLATADDEGTALREERARRFGRRDRAEDDLGTPVATTTAAPVVEEPTSTRAMPVTEPASEPAPTAAAEDDPFRDFDEGPTSRAAAHWWSILVAVVLTPVAWFLIADGGERTSFSLDAGNLNIAGPIELAGGILCLFLVLLATRWSSVGAIIVGVVALLAGGAYLAVNDLATTFVTDNQDILVRLGQIGQNALDYLVTDARSGRLVVYGVVLIMAGVISHGARRQGRREERRKAAIGA